MDSELRKALADAFSDMERGASVEDCLKRSPSMAAELRPHLETWQAMSAASLVQPSVSALARGRQSMQAALSSPPAGFSPASAARLAPAWATVAAAVAAVMVLMGGAAGASAALGGPDPAGDVLSAVGVTDGDGGISNSSASDRGLACANPNAFDGAANSEDKGENSEEAADKDCEEEGGDTVNASEDACEDANKGHGNDADHDDDDNPGQGEGNHGEVTNDDAAPATDAATEDNTDTDAETDCPEDTASEECSDANRGHGNDEDGFDEDNPGQGQGLEERASGNDETGCPEATEAAADEEGDENRGHGNDADRTDEDNPGQGQGNHGADTENAENAEQGVGNDNKPEKNE